MATESDFMDAMAGDGFVSVGPGGRVPLMATNPLPSDVLLRCIAQFGPQIHFHPAEKYVPCGECVVSVCVRVCACVCVRVCACVCVYVCARPVKLLGLGACKGAWGTVEIPQLQTVDVPHAADWQQWGHGTAYALLHSNLA
jgi:hypothetical protein